jgi:hypothetical protein
MSLFVIVVTHHDIVLNGMRVGLSGGADPVHLGFACASCLRNGLTEHKSMQEFRLLSKQYFPHVVSLLSQSICLRLLHSA